MESAKEKAIREAYREHWHEDINPDGWSKSRPQYKKNGNWYDAMPLDIKDSVCVLYRPKSIQCIETNNGWTRIESEADLPIEGGDYWVINNREIKKGIFSPELSKWLCSGKITHYQPIIKPQPPIY